MFAAFGVASPFLPALLHERGLGPSEIGAVLAAGTAVSSAPFVAASLIEAAVIGEAADGPGWPAAAKAAARTATSRRTML